MPHSAVLAGLNGAFIAAVGAMAMGSTTDEWILAHEFADEDPADVATVHEEMVEAASGRNVWIVGGGDLAWARFTVAPLHEDQHP